MAQKFAVRVVIPVHTNTFQWIFLSFQNYGACQKNKKYSDLLDLFQNVFFEKNPRFFT